MAPESRTETFAALRVPRVELALGRGSVLPADRQAAGPQDDRDRGHAQAGAARRLPEQRIVRGPAQSADSQDPARRGAVPLARGEDPRRADADPSGQHGIPVRDLVPVGVARGLRAAGSSTRCAATRHCSPVAGSTAAPRAAPASSGTRSLGWTCLALRRFPPRRAFRSRAHSSIAAAGHALDRLAGEAADAHPDSALGRLKAEGKPVLGAEAVQAAEEGDEAAQRIIEIWAERVGIGIANAINTFDPEEVVIGGGAAQGRSAAARYGQASGARLRRAGARAANEHPPGVARRPRGRSRSGAAGRAGGRGQPGRPGRQVAFVPVELGSRQEHGGRCARVSGPGDWVERK